MCTKFKKKEGLSVAYCTNCGKETTNRKLCEHCGARKNNPQNFCRWCGTPIDVNAKICPNCKEPKKSGSAIMRVVGYIFSLLCLISAFNGYPVIGSVCFALAAILAFPLVKKIIVNATHNNHKLRKILILIRIIAVVALFVAALSAVPTSERDNANDAEIDSNQSAQEEYEELSEEKINTLVAEALYKEIDGNKNYRSSLDPGETRYEIANIEEEEKQYIVYGNGGFYDKYGNPCKPYSDNSGSYSFDFEVTINRSTGRVSRCKIK